MYKHYTETELNNALKDLTFIVDRREQVNEHITKYFDDKQVKYINRKLDIGDYACQLGDMTFEKDFCIEKKNGLDEICGNLTADRDRFEREFLRAKANNTKVYLLVENASWQDVYTHNYSSKLSTQSLLGSLLAWQTRFNITIIFCPKSYSPKMIHSILVYAARERLLTNI